MFKKWWEYLREGDLIDISWGKDGLINSVFEFLDWTPMRKENGKRAYAATIINLKNKGLSFQQIANEIDQMEMDAIYSDLMPESSELYGNCGMFAVALLEEGIRRGKEVEVVFLHDTEDPLADEDYNLFHVAVYHGGSYYDGRGQTTEEDMAKLVPLGLTTKKGEKAMRGRDYNLDSYVVEDKDGLSYVLEKIESLTDWTQTCKHYNLRAVSFWDNLEKK